MRDIEMILPKLTLLHNADLQFRIGGSDHHRYRLNPCLPEEEINAFERQHGVRLPEEYRAFLLHAGDGGAGPGYGLFPLQETVISDGESYLACPFPSTEWWNGMTPPNWWDLPNAHELTSADTQPVDRYFGAERVEGSLRLAHDGCGYYKHLIINGSERGYLWEDGRAGDGGIRPEPYIADPYRVEGYLLVRESGARQRLTFLAWYEQWLDTSLAKI